jgi:hypothetical protein
MTLHAFPLAMIVPRRWQGTARRAAPRTVAHDTKTEIVELSEANLVASAKLNMSYIGSKAKKHANLMVVAARCC